MNNNIQEQENLNELFPQGFDVDGTSINDDMFFIGTSSTSKRKKGPVVEQSFEKLVPEATIFFKKLASKFAWLASNEDDLVQEALIALHSAYQKDNGQHAPRGSLPWLYSYGWGTGMNAMRNWVKVESGHFIQHVSCDPILITDMDRKTQRELEELQEDKSLQILEEKMEDEACFIKLENEMLKLSDAQQKLIYDIYIARIPQKKIAEIQGVSAACINIKAKNAIKRIKKGIFGKQVKK